VDNQLIEQERRKLTRRLDEVEKMCESTAPPATFYGEMLKRVLESLAAPAGVVWTRTAQGNLQMQFQINMGEVGLDRSPESRSAHDELLRFVVSQEPPRPVNLPPRSGVGAHQEGKPPAGNPTEFLLLIVPIVQNEQVVGLIEVWQAPNRPASAVPGFLQYMALMANLAARYQRHQMLGQMAGQQQLWTQLEAFARKIHNSLNPTEVAYHIANEGNRLIECDRVVVGVRMGRKVHIEAVSGCDVVEHRSNEVRCLRRLCQAVQEWGEKLVFQGIRDESLPPKVGSSLDEYLAERPSKTLVVMPLFDERDGEAKDKERKPARSVLVMEAFEPPPEQVPQLMARLEVVGRHATSALYNAVEHKRIPMRFLWKPLAYLQEGLGGKAKAISALVVAGISLLVAVLIFMPYPLKMDSTGQLLPQVRRVLYPPTTGTIQGFDVDAGEVVGEKRVLGRMYDINLEAKINNLTAEIDAADIEFRDLESRAKNENLPSEKVSLGLRALQARNTRDSKTREREDLLNRTGSVRGKPGEFTLQAPPFTTEEVRLVGSREWTVLTGNFKEDYPKDKEAKPSDPLLRLGAKDGPWELEVKIPQKHIGQVLRAFERDHVETLDVDFLLRSDPTRVFKGKLSRDRIAGEANPNRDDNNESEPVVLAYVRITGDDIPAEERLPRELLLSGTEIHSKVRCGSARMGYALFYGVWEFLYEKVVFFF